MLSRQAKWQMLAGAVMLLGVALTSAQPALPPKTPAQPATGSASSVQIIPVSLSSDAVAATVNGEKITVGEVKKILDQRPYPLTLNEEQKKYLRHAALDVLIEDAVMRQYLSKYVPKVNQAEFNKVVAELTESLKKQNKTIESFLKESGQSQEQLSRDIVSRLQWKALLEHFCPDDKAKAYYTENKLFFDKVAVRASHILIKLDAKTTKAERDKAEQVMLVWRKEILEGKVKFEEVAKKYSECPSKDKGGDIGKFSYKFEVLPEFAKTAYAMKVGELSAVVKTSAGLHLIYVTDRTPPEPSTFESVKEFVRDAWAQEEDLYQRVLVDQRKKGDIKVSLP